MQEFEFLKSNAKQHRKKEFGNQKTKFRDYLKTLENKWTPLVVIKLHHKKFEISGWNQWIQYHAVKKTLTNGLQVHLFSNDKVKVPFGIEIEAQRVALSKVCSVRCGCTCSHLQISSLRPYALWGCPLRMSMHSECGHLIDSK